MGRGERGVHFGLGCGVIGSHPPCPRVGVGVRVRVTLPSEPGWRFLKYEEPLLPTVTSSTLTP